MAAQSGLESAVQLIKIITDTNKAFVTGLTNYGANGGVATLLAESNLTNSSQLIPLVSFPVDMLASFRSAAWTNSLAEIYQALVGTNSVNLNDQSRLIQYATNSQIYRGSWITVTNQSGKAIARYAFHVLDEAGRLNPLIHTGQGTMTNATNWYTGPADISLTNASGRVLTPGQQSTIDSKRNLFWTSESFGQAFASKDEADLMKHLLTAHSAISTDVIPAWLPQGGMPKYNLNVLATNPSVYVAGSTNAVDAVSVVIRSNLPQFSSRDPSLRGNANTEARYLSRLAASIVDYIDQDSVSSAANGGEPAGRDLFPHVTTVAEQFRWTTETPGPPQWRATVETKVFIQLWNPYTVPVSGQVGFRLRNRVRLNYGTGIVQPLDDYSTPNDIPVTIRANEFVVVELPPTSKIVSSPTLPPSSGTLRGVYWVNTVADAADQTTHPHFELYWNGVLSDMNRRTPPAGPGIGIAGLPRNGKNLSLSAWHYQVNAIVTQSGSSPPFRFVGDPRATFLSSYDWGSPLSSDTAYASSSRWGGRNRDTFPYSQAWSSTWINRDFVRADPSMGNSPGNIDTPPSAVPSAYIPAVDGPAAMAFLRNGPMVSISELGNVFDPIQAADDLSAPTGGTPASPYVAAGGRTLRIGQPEFSASGVDTWNTSGRRAVELLDVFTVQNTNAASGGYPSAFGRLNPNTAPKEVLAALLSGIQVRSDSGIPPATLANLTDIAESIITNRPYSAISDLYKVATNFSKSANYSPAFPTSFGGGHTNLAALDRVREEAFGKFVSHLSVQSRSYRAFIAGEALDAQGKPTGRVFLEAVITIPPDTATPPEPLILFQRFSK